jgi:alcohol dehydrogenase class IV
MEFNLIGDLEKFARIAQALGERIEGLSLRDAAERAPAAVRRLSADIGIVARMRELSIPEDAVDGMAESAIKVSRLLGNNPRGIGLEDARRIYRAAW